MEPDYRIIYLNIGQIDIGTNTTFTHRVFRSAFSKKKYGVTKQEFNKGSSIKIYGEELGGKDFLSSNYYITNTTESLKPCEMPEQKVIDFLKGYECIKCRN